MNSVSLRLVALAALLFASFTLGKNDVNPKLVISEVSRKIDLSTQLTKISTSLTIENGGDSSTGFFHLAIEPSLVDKLAFVGATARNPEDEESSLVLSEVDISSHSETKFFKVELGFRLKPGDSVDVTTEEVFVHAMTPFPTKISQSEKQYVVFSGNHYYYSPYAVKKQTATVSLATSSVESHTKLKPSSLSDNAVTYGPYSDVEAYSADPMRVHFENSTPFLSVVGMTRTIEVSHWGNIAVEETYHMKHVGAELKGSFSRYDYQRTAAPASIKSFKSVLPAAASDVYYRDEIGNISTSNLWSQEDSVELELRPRFPLFGGWQTRFYMGYNVPSYEYLYNLGNRYILKMRVVDHIFDEFVVDHLVLRIILPEGCTDIQLKTPFKMDEGKRELHFTYLDTVGRPVIVAHKSSLVEQHIQDFELHYSFNKVLLLQEPLLIVGAFYLLFMAVIIYMRLDFAISKDEANESRMRAACLIEEVQRLLDRQSGLYSVYADAIQKYKQSKDATAFANARKKLDGDYRAISNQISQVQASLSKEQPEAAEKLTELQRKENEKKQLLDSAIVMAEKLVNNRLSKQGYLEGEGNNKTKRQKLSAEIESLAACL